VTQEQDNPEGKNEQFIDFLEDEGTNNDDEDPANKGNVITSTEEEMSIAAR
jgi:hypothetical protein